MTEMDMDMLEAALTKGWSNQRTAKALGVGLSTLKRNFGPLMRMRHEMPDRLELVLFAVTMRKALAGDTGAIRQVRQMVADNERRLADARLREVAATESDEEPKGKKEQRRQRVGELVEGGDDEWGSDIAPGMH
jgi:hypothetical protein